MSFLSKTITKVLSPALIFALLFNVIGVPVASASSEAPLQSTPKSRLTANIGDLPNKLPKSKVELPSKRTENSETYLNPDGSFTTKIFSDAQYYQDPADKKLKPIDNSLVSSSKTSSKLENKANDFTVSFGTQTATAGDSLITVQKDGKSVSMNPVGANSSQGTANGNTINYPNVFTNADLKYSVLGDKVKEDLVLKKSTNQNVYSFELKLKGLSAAVDTNGLISLSDGKDKVWSFEKPFMIDANGKRSDNVSFKLRNAGGKTFVDVIADSQFLQDPATQYPVTIDPTITDWQVQRDNFVASAFPTAVFSSNTYLNTGYNSYFGSTRSLVQFYLPALPSSSKIQSAQFGAYQTVQNSTNTSVDLYRATSAWPASVTWNSQPALGITPESTTTNNTSNAYWTWNVTQLAKDWYNGSQANNGLVLKQQNEGSSANRSFNSVNSGVNAPYLAINYTVDPIGLENFWGFSKDGVNPANGNLVLQETDLSIPGRGIPVSLARTYNSQKSEAAGMFGYGWTSSLEARIIDGGSGPLTFVDGDGTSHFIGQDYDGNYYAYGGIYLSFVKNTDGTYTVTQTDGSKINFNTSGKVVSMTDTNGNTTSLTYNGSGKLTTITDASGRAASLAYGTNGYVSSVTDPANRTVSYNYDTSGNLTKVTDFTTKAHSFAYDASHNLTGITDPNSINTTLQYDTSDRLIQINRPLTINGAVQTSTTNYVYDPAHTVTQVTDGEGRRIDYTYNANGNITQTTENPLDTNNQAVTTFAYDNNNNLTQITDPNANKANNGQAYVYQYDANGNITKVQLPQGQVSTNTYDTNNNLTTATDFNSNLSSNSYDSQNNQTEATDPSAQTSANRYDTNGNLLNYTPPMSASDNLIPNSSFEQDNDANNWPDNWSKEIEANKTATFAWSTTSKIGQKSVSVSNPTGWAIAGTDLFPYTTGDKYVLSGYVKTAATTGTAVVKLAFYDTNNNWIGQQMAYQLKGTNDWTRVQAVVDSVPANTAKIQLTVGLNAGSGTAYFDGVQLEKGSVLSAYNLIDNSSLERDGNADGIPDNWTTSGNLSVNDKLDQTPYIGQNSFKMTGESGKNKYIKQHINVSGDATSTFTLSGWSKQMGANPGGGYYNLQVAINNSDGSEDWNNASNFDKNASGWQHIAAQVKPTKAFTSIDVYYYYYNQTGTAWFDAMRFEQGASNTFNTYDANGNYVTKIQDPLGNIFAAAYDSLGNQTSTTDAKNQQTSFSYDFMSRLTQVTDAKLGVTTYGYDNAGNRTSVKDANNHTSTYSYNEANQVSSFTNALNQTINFGYDKNGNTTKIVFPKGDTVTYSYNALNRMDGAYYNGTKKWGLGYDANGNLTSVSDGTGTTVQSMEYDGNNRLTKQTESSANSLNYGYDDNSNLTSLTATAGSSTVTTGYAYNPLNLMVSLSRNGVNQAKFVYDERGNVISDNYGNGTYSAYEYDKLNQLTSLKNYGAAGNLLDSYAYSYDGNSNVTSIVTNAGTISYQYDALNQLTQETQLDGTTIAYQYDAAGNRTKKTVNGSAVTNYTYDAANELTAVNGQAYSYDANGNLTGNGAKTFVYDAENHLTQVKGSGGNTLATYSYDYTGKRTSMTTASGTIYFHYAGNNVAYETDANNNIVADYTWDAQGHPVTMTKNGVTYYYQLNGHGDVVKLTDAGGNVLAQYQYDAWGNILSQSGTIASANPYRYAGYRYDEVTGLYYLMARYYDAGAGLFITKDTFHGFEYDPQSLNQYAYSKGNPIMFVDPSGHWAFDIISVRLAGAAFNYIIGGVVGGFTAGVITAYIRRVGSQAAARLFYITIASKLSAWGAKKLAVGLSFAIGTLLNYLDIGTAVAKWIDARDPKPNNTWLTI